MCPKSYNLDWNHPLTTRIPGKPNPLVSLPCGNVFWLCPPHGHGLYHLLTYFHIVCGLLLVVPVPYVKCDLYILTSGIQFEIWPFAASTMLTFNIIQYFWIHYNIIVIVHHAHTHIYIYLYLIVNLAISPLINLPCGMVYTEYRNTHPHLSMPKAQLLLKPSDSFRDSLVIQWAFWSSSPQVTNHPWTAMHWMDVFI